MAPLNILKVAQIRSPLYQALPAIFLTFQLLIPHATCKFNISNSSLKTKSVYTYSKHSTASRPIHQTRTCASQGTACSSTIDCCQPFGNYEFACAKFGNSTPTCQRCVLNGEKCCKGDTECCTGSTCSRGICVPTGRCIEESKACWPEYHQCCDGIVNADGKSYCSDECSGRYGQCPTLDTTDGCCPGHYCFDSSWGPICDCGYLGEPCIVGSIPKTCCGQKECDPSTSTCESCIAPGKSCAQTEETRSCCANLPCDSVSGTCCIAKDATCDPTILGNTCCDGLKCIQSNGIATCKIKCAEGGQFCRRHQDHGWELSAGLNFSECCSPLTCDSYTHKCCAAEGIPCGVGTPCCRGLSCDTSTHVCNRNPCVPRGSSCNEENICCCGLACDRPSKVCMGGTGTHCNSTNLCTSDHECNQATSSCYPKWCVNHICPPQFLPGAFYPTSN